VARSTLSALVSGTRAILAAQLIVAVAAIAMAGWTLGVTDNLIRERDRLRNRVIQLEETMASRGIVVPATPPIVDAPTSVAANGYPGALARAREIPRISVASAGSGTQQTSATVEPAEADTRSLRRVLGDLFSPPPPMQTLVLHVRSEMDAAAATSIAGELAGESDVRVLINVMSAGDRRPSGYAYFDGRQSRAAADLVTQFHDVARRLEVAPWSAQLRGVALPARGEYSADRLDITLPALPPPPAAVAVEPPPPATGADTAGE